MKVYDPYDIWSLPALGKIKTKWTSGHRLFALSVPLIGAMEMIAPNYFRKILGVKPHIFAHIAAMRYFSDALPPREALEIFKATRVQESAWGLPFAWFSKNGAYSANTPYVTNTPYVMEALVSLSQKSDFQVEAKSLFWETWDFLESLEIMYSTNTQLALSYAPVHEPRKVVNANSYAALAYALHSVHGQERVRDLAADYAERLVNWILDQQQPEGNWFYYADNAPGNFIDGFHSCFIVKNLLKTQKLLPHLVAKTQPAINKGWEYIRKNIYDSKHNLCQRYSQRSHRDPFRWDLYDQAEYLGLLVDFALYDEAREFISNVELRFFKDGHWYCRIDILGRRWGKDFLRWGVAPYLYHKHRMQLLDAETH